MRRLPLSVPLLAGLWLGTATHAWAQLNDSPFLPAGGTAGAVVGGPPPAYELAGTSVRGNTIRLCLFDNQSKRSHWITVGETVDHVKVVSYNSSTEQAVILVNGSQQSLAMRKTSVNAIRGPQPLFQPPAPTPSPVTLASAAPANPPPPNVDPTIEGKAPEVVKQERDARMLVSDLLEIGMQQRKAYEEAQKKAAATPPGGL